MYAANFKKNPFMSMWLSAANSAAGAARGFWIAELHRQQIAMMSDMTEQMIRFWSGGWMTPPEIAARERRPRHGRKLSGGRGAKR